MYAILIAIVCLDPRMVHTDMMIDRKAVNASKEFYMVNYVMRVKSMSSG